MRTVRILVLIATLAASGPVLAQATGNIEQPGRLMMLPSRAVPLKLGAAQVLPQPPGAAAASPGPAAIPGPGAPPVQLPDADNPAGTPRLGMELDTAAKGKYTVGEVFRVKAKVTNADGHLYIYDFGTSGTITELYPRTDVDQPLKAGSVVTLDGTKDEQWVVSGPTGLDYIVGWVTSGPARLNDQVLNEKLGGAANRRAKIEQVMAKVEELTSKRSLLGGFGPVLEVDIQEPGGASTQAGTSGTSTPSPAPSAVASASPAAGGTKLVARSTFPPEKCFALCVGIGEYKNTGDTSPITALPAAARDATAFRDKLGSAMKVPPANMRLITNAEATRDGIMQGLAWLKEKATGADNAAYVYWAGHGTEPLQPEGGEGVSPTGLVPHDYEWSAPTENSKLVLDREMGAWIEGMQSGALVMVIDACYSGGMTKASGKKGLIARGFFTPPRIPSKTVVWQRGKPHATNTSRPNVWVIQAAQITQQAYEDPGTTRGLVGGRLLELFDEGLPGPILFQRVQSWVSEFAHKYSVEQVPALVDTTNNPEFVPFRKN